MKRSNLVLFVYLSLVFASGVLVGTVGYHFYAVKSAGGHSHHWRPEEYRRRYVEAMKKCLKLTARQLQQLNAILDTTRERFHSLENETIKPRKRAIFAAQVKAFEAILTPQQRTEYEKLRREHAAARKQRAEKGRSEHDRRRKDGR